ncbi:hypothetical protein KVT40_005363 [Elsinoe batatas]|uniref:MACPF domain-containing protein n=1 Tax=Elsinoe batatas TaxID=2601811 RepID=A0A8K0L1D6_9PEZI|nr:hypothetical protein KVT40_005363 [Elsinoe batatas]
MTTAGSQKVEGRTQIQIPYRTEFPLSLGSALALDLSETARTPLMIYDSPVDLENLTSTNALFLRSDGQSGTYLSTAVSNQSSVLNDLSLSLGVSLGSSYLGTGVTGSYEKASSDAKQMDTTTRRMSVQAGTVHLASRIQLTEAAQRMLRSKPGGYQAFREAFGDFYVSGAIIGGEAAVTVMTKSESNASADKIKITAEAHFLCFSGETTVAEKDFNSAYHSLQFGVVAFDSLTQHLVDMPLAEEQSLPLDKARQLCQLFDEFVQNMQQRVEASMSRWPELFRHRAKLTSRDLSSIMRSGLVTQLVLTPWSTHRDVRPFALAE